MQVVGITTYIICKTMSKFGKKKKLHWSYVINRGNIH